MLQNHKLLCELYQRCYTITGLIKVSGPGQLNSKGICPYRLMEYCHKHIEDFAGGYRQLNSSTSIILWSWVCWRNTLH